MLDSRPLPKSVPVPPRAQTLPRPSRLTRWLSWVAIIIAVPAITGSAVYFATGEAVVGPPEGGQPVALVAQPPSPATPRAAASAAVPTQSASVAEGADRRGGYAIELGAALSFVELSARFAKIAELNAEAEFDRLEPRATLKDTDKGLEARLLVGPFADENGAGTTCVSLALPAGITCRVVPFEGELISRE